MVNLIMIVDITTVYCNMRAGGSKDTPCRDPDPVICRVHVTYWLKLRAGTGLSDHHCALEQST